MFGPRACLGLWRLNKPVTQLLGVKIKAFIFKFPEIATLMRSRESGLRQTEEIVSFAKALDLWYSIEHHLKRAKVTKEEVDEFPSVLEKFETNIISFYECGTDTFLSGNEVGEDETFYIHTLKYYILARARKTWKDHKCGIGVFTMQGFKRRNKESKNILRQFNNMKNQMLSQILKQFWDSFFYNNDHVKQEIMEDIVDNILQHQHHHDGDDGSRMI